MKNCVKFSRWFFGPDCRIVFQREGEDCWMGPTSPVQKLTFEEGRTFIETLSGSVYELGTPVQTQPLDCQDADALDGLTGYSGRDLAKLFGFEVTPVPMYGSIKVLDRNCTWHARAQEDGTIKAHVLYSCLFGDGVGATLEEAKDAAVKRFESAHGGNLTGEVTRRQIIL